MDNTLVSIKNLVKYFPIKKGVFRKTVGWVKAVDGISFDIYSGETLGLVGESGCGKSTTAMTILRLEEPTGGDILFQGKNIAKIKKGQMRKYRKDLQVIFQDPYSSLDPRMKVRNIIAEGLAAHNIYNFKKRYQKVGDLLEKVGIVPEYMDRFPHEFSGGQRQRIGIARALALDPKMIICDEAVSALDVSIRSQIINLFKDLQEEFNLTYLFIAHDLSVIKYISDRVAVMYLGKIVEIASKEIFFKNTLHPYAQALVSAVPVPNPDFKKKRIILQGDVPSPANPPKGCRFHPRCPKAMEICSREEPLLREIEKKHFVACHLY
ncbi:MAG: ABC transporter ATP-binding protein [Candidatus Caldatribacteriota bacterium]|jgi:oligopeptide/dipeptide ABC transporter ATP-binding protein|nr:ABC transporter ATP-binding protein [Atribacterota bacterium]MDD3030759.1 ABC transporter ATP-binding protein [Atribacterota bacterium]MDD3640418.1 ABC transporter ATP-binding protein [Atribacterota bacterium]MDD4288210.1 ABC transporter ATP-binding protein [Atribacterota bacterium]MDD4764413.1 ABC transporter ATP-binding protein [Atribacterota bacterium]